MIRNIILAESIKSKRTFVPWYLVLGSVLVPIVCFLIYVNRWSFFTPEQGTNGWSSYLQMNVSFSAGLLLPFWIILLVALNIHPEQKGNAWKRLFVTPVGKGRLFAGKLIYLCLQVAVTMAGFFTAIALTGLAAQGLHPNLAMNLNDLPVGNLLLTGIGLTLCLLPMMTIQYVFSLVTNNVLVPAAIGLFTVIVSLVLVQGWTYAVYDPFAFPILYSWNESGKMALPHWLGLVSIEWFSLIACVLMGGLGWWWFRRRSVK